MIPEHRAKRGLWLKPLQVEPPPVSGQPGQPYSRPSQPRIPIHPGAGPGQGGVPGEDCIEMAGEKNTHGT